MNLDDYKRLFPDSWEELWAWHLKRELNEILEFAIVFTVLAAIFWLIWAYKSLSN